MAELAQIVETGPDPKIDGLVRWRRVDLQRVIATHFGVGYHERCVGKLLHKLGFSHLSPRFRHRRKTCGSSRHLKNFANVLNAHLPELPDGTPVEIWFEDEARVVRRTASCVNGPSGAPRPRQPVDQRYEKRHLPGARRGQGFGPAFRREFRDLQP